MNIDNLKLNITEHNASVGKVIEALNTAYESGHIKALMAVYASPTGMVCMISGEPMVMPTVALAAGALSERVIDGFTEVIFGYDPTDNGGDE